ncbi:MAG: choice-of-anchor Q domain-containing protein [Limisphaerales bacterium]
MNTIATTYFVNASNTVPQFPFMTWATAATNIQDAINVSSDGDLVLVTDGLYQTGATSLTGSNRVAVNKAITLQSINGPAKTIIKGYQVPGTTNGTTAIRCVYLASGAVLSGFTLTNGATFSFGGGGVFCQSSNAIVDNCYIVNNASAGSAGGGATGGTFKNCVITGNIAFGIGGGGAAQCTLENCIIAGNRAVSSGGGVYFPISMVNCTVSGNSCGSAFGGGIYGGPGAPFRGIFLNTIIYFNDVSSSSPYTNVYAPVALAVSNCCAPEFSGYIGSGCSTNWPGFYDTEHGDYRLQIGSPCINTGNNDFVTNATDLAGNSRIFGGTVDMGAYENQFSGIAHFVSIRGTNPVAPYTNWLTAATNIQSAIDVAGDGETVIVSNGVYRTGGRVVYETLTNRVVLDRPISVQSLNGPSVTVIQGYQFPGASAVRCAYLTNGATLMGFTLTNGALATSGDTIRSRSGGGAWCESTNATLINCVIRSINGGNAYYGAGVFSGTLSNCLIRDNLSAQYGGGAAYSTLIGCVVSNNTSVYQGGGTFGGLVSGCFLLGNSSVSGGGAASNVLLNCTLANNKPSGSSPFVSGGGAYACTLTNCILFGNVATNGGGAAYSLLVNCTLTNNLATKSGGGTFFSTLTNCTVAGNRATNSGGGAVYGILSGCLLTNNTAGAGGGTASNVLYFCTLVGNYATGNGGAAYFATLTNCLVQGNVANQGGGLYDCFATSCTISNNSAQLGGGGFESDLLSCLVSSNYAQVWGGGYCYGTASSSIIKNNRARSGGGGVAGGSSKNCLIINNNALGGFGGGANSTSLTNCTVVGNIAMQGGGTYSPDFPDGSYVNCIVYFNNAMGPDANTSPYPGQFNFCCTLPLPPGGIGNFTNAPLFLDNAYHLQTNSPCIDAGNSDLTIGGTDLDGRPRIVGASVDVGVMEFQGIDFEAFISWLYQYGLPTDGSGDFVDSDGDMLNNWQEWKSGTIPTNSTSVLRLVSPVSSPDGLVVTWQSVTNVTYYLERSSDLAGQFSSMASNLVGLVNSTSYTDAAATNSGSYFYRVGVQ